MSNFDEAISLKILEKSIESQKKDLNEFYIKYPDNSAINYLIKELVLDIYNLLVNKNKHIYSELSKIENNFDKYKFIDKMSDIIINNKSTFLGDEGIVEIDKLVKRNINRAEFAMLTSNNWSKACKFFQVDDRIIDIYNPELQILRYPVIKVYNENDYILDYIDPYKWQIDLAEAIDTLASVGIKRVK